MEQVLDERPAPITCIFCGKQMRSLLLGARRIVVWVHDEADFKQCKMIKFDADFTSEIMKNVSIWKKDFDKFKKTKNHRLDTCHK